MSQLSGKGRTKGSFHFLSFPLLIPADIALDGLGNRVSLKKKALIGRKREKKKGLLSMGTGKGGVGTETPSLGQ